MSVEEFNFVFQLGVTMEWLKVCENQELIEFIHNNNINTFVAKNMRDLRRKYRMRDYRIESYYKKTILNLLRTKEELVDTKSSLENEISFLKDNLQH